MWCREWQEGAVVQYRRKNIKLNFFQYNCQSNIQDYEISNNKTRKQCVTIIRSHHRPPLVRAAAMLPLARVHSNPTFSEGRSNATFSGGRSNATFSEGRSNATFSEGPQ